MPAIQLPDTLSNKYWSKSAGSDIEKSSKVGEVIKELERACDEIEPKALEVDGLDNKEIPKRRERIATMFKTLDKIAALLKKLEAEANKTLPEAKKAGKESAVRAILSSVKVFNGEVGGFREEAGKVDETLAKGNLNAAKPAAKADPKVAAALKKQVDKLGAFSRKSIRELQSGKAKVIPFVFGACKEKEPFKAGKEWEKRCLIYLHPKATKASRSILQKLLLPSPVWAIGEATCTDGKKITFNCTETPPANIKQLKDALKYQMKNYAPPLRVMKGNKVEGEEAGEGKDDEVLDVDAGELEDDADIPVSATSAPTSTPATAPSKRADKEDNENDSAAANEKVLADLKKRLANRSQQIQQAILKGDKSGKELKDWTVALSAALKNGSNSDEAARLMKRIEDRLNDGGGAAEEVSDDLDKALKDLAQARKAAANGATRVAALIRKSYEGDPQAKKAAEGAARIEAANQKLLATNVESTIQAQLRGADTRKRQQVAEVVQRIRDAIEKNELLPDIDKSPFDPNLNVVAPYIATLKNVESMLRAGR